MPGADGHPLPLVVFSHGNSFPGGTYGVLFRGLRARGHAVQAVDRYGHDPHYPVSSNWPHLVRQLADFCAQQVASHAGPLYLVGHSLGGFLSVMCAATHPVIAGRRVSGVVLLDSPLLSGWRARAVQLAKRTRLVGAFSPGRVSQRRRQSWPSEQAVREHFQAKRAFAAWHPQVLEDYITHGTADEAGPQGPRRVLRFDRGIETAIYNTLPHQLPALLRRHPLRCPVAFVGGRQSRELQQVGLDYTRRVVGAKHPDRLVIVEGSHLFPMEHPLETAAVVARLLADMPALDGG